MNRFEKKSSLIWLISSLIIIGIASTYPFGTWSRPGPGFLPLLCGIVMAVLSAVVLLQALWESRRIEKKTEGDGIPCILEADQSSKEYRKNWARLIQKIYEVDPLTFPKCGGSMRILAFIEDREVIKAILKHLGLWLVRSKPTPKAHAPPARNRSESGQTGYVLNHFSQLPLNDDHLHRDPDYPWDAYFQS